MPNAHQPHRPLANVTRWASIVWDQLDPWPHADALSIEAACTAILCALHKESRGNPLADDNVKVSSAYGLLQRLIKFSGDKAIGDPSEQIAEYTRWITPFMERTGGCFPTVQLALGYGQVWAQQYCAGLYGDEEPETIKRLSYFDDLYGSLFEVYSGWVAGWVAAGRPTRASVFAMPERTIAYKTRVGAEGSLDVPEAQHSLALAIHEVPQADPLLDPYEGYHVYKGLRREVRLPQAAAPPAPTPAPYRGQIDDTRPTLRRRDRGQAVTSLQESLARIGLDPGSIDGIFGPATDRAVERLQRRSGLSIDGVVGRKTWAAIDEALAAGGLPDEIKPDPGALALGDRIFDLHVGGKRLAGPEGVVLRRGVQFKAQARSAKGTDSQIFHLSAGPGNPSLYFRDKGLGVHLFVELDGAVWVGGDLLGAMSHAGFLNARTIAYEVRNSSVIFDPQGSGQVWAHALNDRFLKARWAWRQVMVLPTDAQLDALWRVFSWVQEACADHLKRSWWGLSNSGISHDRLPSTGYKPGIGAHRHYSTHGDGVIEASYLFYRAQGCDHGEALTRTIADHADDGQAHLLDTIAPDRPRRPLGPKGAADAVRLPWET